MNEKELDLGPIKERLESGDYYSNPSWAEPDIADLVAEVERLRGQLRVFFEVLTDEELNRVRLHHLARLKIGK